MSVGPDESTLLGELAFASETTEQRAARVARMDDLMKQGLDSEERLDEFAKLLGLRYDEHASRHRAK